MSGFPQKDIKRSYDVIKISIRRVQILVLLNFGKLSYLIYILYILFWKVFTLFCQENNEETPTEDYSVILGATLLLPET